jgi:protein-S-isoprenylcysteine O-methyltransferase Ste14
MFDWCKTGHHSNVRARRVLTQSQFLLAIEMLKFPPPISALVYVLTAAVISWFFGWSKVPGLPLAPLGIFLVAISWIPPVWAIVLFRREGTELEPTSPINRKLITGGPYQTRNPMYLGLVILTLGIAIWVGAWPMFGVPIALGLVKFCYTLR